MKLRGRIFVAMIFLIVALTSTTVVLALSWSEPVRIGSGRYTQDLYPEVATDDNGNAYVVWTSYPDGRYLYFNHFDGNRWTGAQRPHPHITNSFYADVAVGPAGDAHIIWSGIGPRSFGLFYTRYDGNSWTRPRTTGLRASGSIAVSPTGEVFIANPGGLVQGNNGAFSTPFPPLPEWYGKRLDLSFDSEGTLYVAYQNRFNSRPAYRTWTGSAWSEATYLDDQIEECERVEMFHGDVGTADYFCMTGTRILHWHRDEDAWQDVIEVTAANEWFFGDTAGNANGLAAATWIEGNHPRRNEKEEVFVRVWTGSEWLPPENVSQSRWRSLWNSVGITSDDRVITVWSENENHTFPWYLTARIASIPIFVDIDVKPEGEPNSINCENSNAKIPVAILTTDDFDALSVDHSTVTFEGAIEFHHRRRAGELIRHETDVDGDGDLDLLFHFRLDDTELTCKSRTATLQGQTYGGEAIEGTASLDMVEPASQRP